MSYFFFCLFHFVHMQMNFAAKWHAKMRSFNLCAIHFHGLPSTAPAMDEHHTRASSAHNRKASKKKVSICMPNHFYITRVLKGFHSKNTHSNHNQKKKVFREQKTFNVEQRKKNNAPLPKRQNHSWSPFVVKKPKSGIVVEKCCSKVKISRQNGDATHITTAFWRLVPALPRRSRISLNFKTNFRQTHTHTHQRW